MEKTPEADENSHTRKKRSSILSPFSDATPKSRMGKEPKRAVFGRQFVPNAADENLEATLIETASRPSSATPSELTEVSDTTYNDTLDQSTVMDTSEENSTQPECTTPTPLSDSMGTSSTPTAPAPCLPQIQKTLDALSMHAPQTAIDSPAAAPLKQVNESLCEFMVLEKEADCNAVVDDLRSRIADLESEIQEINNARRYEEQVLMEQTQTVVTKAKSEKADLLKIIAEKEDAIRRAEEIQNTLGEKVRQLEEQSVKDQDQSAGTMNGMTLQKEDDSNVIVDELRSEIVKLESEIEHLKDLRCYEAAITAAEVQELVQETKSEKAGLLKTIAEKDDSIQRGEEIRKSLDAKIRELEKQSAEFKLAAEDRQNSLTALQQEHNDVQQVLREKNQELEEKLIAARLEAVKMEDDARDAEAQKLVLDTETHYKAIVDKLRSRIAEFESEIEQINEARRLDEQKFSDQMKNATEEAESGKTDFLKIIAEKDDAIWKAEDFQISLNEKIRELEEQSTEYKRIAEERRSLESVQQEHIAAQTSLEQKIQELEEKIVTANQEAEACKTHAQSVVLDKEADCNAIANQLRSTISDLESEITQLKDEKRIKEVELSEHTAESEERYKELLSAMQEEHTSLQKTLETKILELEENLVAVELEANTIAASALEKEADCKAIVDELRTSIADLQSEITQINDARRLEELAMTEKTQNLIKQSESDKVDFLNIIAEKDDAIHEAEALRKTLEEKILEQEKRLADFDTTAEERHRDSMSAVQQEHDALRKALELKVQELDEKLVAVNLEARALKDQAQSADAMNAMALQKENDFKVIVDELRSTIVRLESEIDHLKDLRCYEAAITAAEVQELVQETKSEKAGLLKTIAEKDDSIQRGEEIRKSLDAKIRELEKQSTDFKLVAEDRQNSLQVLRGQIQELEEKLIATRLETDSSKSQADGILEKEAVVDGLRSRIADLESEITQLNDLRRNEEQFLSETQAVAMKTESEKAELLKILAEKDDAAQKAENLRISLNERIQELEKQCTLFDSTAEDRHKNSLSAIQQEHNDVQRTLEGKIELLEGKLLDANEWKTQAQVISELSGSLAQMQLCIQDLTTKLEESNRRREEVEATAQHDVTIMRDEVGERCAELEAARSRIAELEESLQRAEKEVTRLEGLCDEFDDDERKLKEQIWDLQDQLKAAKQQGKPAESMGLLQQARLGIKPLSREATLVEESNQPNPESYEDAQDSFEQPPSSPSGTSPNLNTSGALQVPRQVDSAQNINSAPVTAASRTMLMHPDDESMLDQSIGNQGTPSKNKSACRQQ